MDPAHKNGSVDSVTPLALEAISYLERGWSIVPSRGEKKSPCLGWKIYQSELPTTQLLYSWDQKFSPERWGIVTGSLSGIIVVDFDGEKGKEWLDRWGLEPHVRSGSGGYHVYFEHPGWLVPTMNAKSSPDGWPFPGVDVRGDGGFIVLLGINQNGPYEVLRDISPYPADELPGNLSKFLREKSATFKIIEEEIQEESSTPTPAQAVTPFEANNNSHRQPRSQDPQFHINRALDNPSGTGRNNDGFSLALQLRDIPLPLYDVERYMLEYQSRVPSTNAKGEREPYTREEALASARSAFTEPPRDSWPTKTYTNGLHAVSQPSRPAQAQLPAPASGDSQKDADASAPPSGIEPEEIPIDYIALLESEVVRIIDAKDVFECYKAPFISICVSAGHNAAFIARERLRQTYKDMRLKGIPGAWDVRYQEEVDRQRQENTPVYESKSTLQPWELDLILTDKGKQVPCYENAALHAENSPDWTGVLGYNEFTAGHVVLEKGPYPITADPGQEIEDHFDTEVTRWFERRGLIVKPEVARRTVDRMARRNSFHPVRDYLGSLPVWDGVPRIGSWLIDYCGVSPTAFNDLDKECPNIFAMEAGARFLISAVARIMKPGCKADHVLMLEGKTGIGKSTTVQIMAGKEFFTDQLSDLGSKDASMQIRGIWIAEIAELHALSRSDREKAKGFVTQTFERFRLPYGKRVTKFQRQCVFIGTTESSEWNTDERGARRFWPVLCNGKINTAGVERDRDQLWAEALSRYNKGDKWYIYKEEALKAAEEVQSSRYAVDVWQERVIEIAEECQSSRGVSVSDILTSLKVPIDRQDQIHMNRVSRCLRFAKWDRRQVRIAGVRQWRYFAPSEETQAELPLSHE